MQEKKVFMKPGKNNREDRLNFVKFWAEYVKNHDDKLWSKQQKILIDSQFINSREFYRHLLKTKEGREKLVELGRLRK